MSTSTALPLHVMPADAARVRAARAGGERLVDLGLSLGHSLWRALELIGESRARSALSELAERSRSTRPELAASLQRAARKSWMD